MESPFFFITERILLVDNNDTITNSSGFYNSTSQVYETDQHQQEQQQEQHAQQAEATEQSFSSTQQIVLTLIPIFSGLISAIASCALLYMIKTDGRHQQQRKIQRSSRNGQRSDDNCYSGCNDDGSGAAAETSSHMMTTTTAPQNDSTQFSLLFRIRKRNNNNNGSDDNSHLPQQKFPLTVYQRIMIGLTLSDLVGSLRAMTSTFLLPADTMGVWKAYGNTATCTFQGFLLQSAGATALLYTMSLGIYYYGTIVYAITDDTMKRRLEPFLHAIPIVFAACTSITGIFLDVYNPLPLGVGCWIAPYPSTCIDETNNVECIRGKDYAIIRLIFLYAPLLICYGVFIFCMGGIYYSVRKQLRNMEFQYGGNSNDNMNTTSTTPTTSSATTTTTVRKSTNVLSDRSKKRLQKVSTQSQLYLSIFFLVYACATIDRVLELRNSNLRARFIVAVLGLILYPSQGFFNFFIYIRPQFVQIRTLHPKLSRLQTLKIALRLEPEPSLATATRS